MAQNKCYICHNRRSIKTAGAYAWVTVYDLELVPQKFKWTMFDGTKIKIDIFKCKDCIREMEEIENFQSESL